MVEEKPFRAMLRALPNEVIRAKGVVRFHHMPGEFYVFQKLEDDVQFFPVGPAPRLSTPLVLFIGPRLPEDDLRAAIEALA
jgi:G3E family GTPase